MGKSRLLASYRIRDSGLVIKAGDSVLLRNPDASGPPYIAKIESIERGRKIKVRWYYRPEDCRGARQTFHGMKEVFLSDHVDSESVDSVDGICKIHSLDTYMKLHVVNEDDYFFRQEYCTANESFVPDKLELFCTCQMPYNPDALMIQCDGCAAWFHTSCVCMAAEEANELANFWCKTCIDAKKRLHKTHEVTSPPVLKLGPHVPIIQPLFLKYEKLWSEGVNKALEDFVRTVKDHSSDKTWLDKIEKDAEHLGATVKSLQNKQALSFLTELTAATSDFARGSEVQKDEKVPSIQEDKILKSKRSVKNSKSAKSQSSVAVIYDEEMLLHKPPAGHGIFYEKPERLESIFQKLTDKKLLDRCDVFKSEEPPRSSLLAVHSERHIKDILSISTKSQEELDESLDEDESIYYSQGSGKAVLLAAGGALKACKLLAEGRYKHSFAIVRPPGHHVANKGPAGFCYMNNVAVGAAHLLDEYKKERILIIDWDIHHGNGTEEIFYRDKRVLFLSIHRHDGRFYPRSGELEHLGGGHGEGFNVNICWTHSDIRDVDYVAVWDHVVLPITEEFQPEFILISAGFDAAHGDPLGDCKVTPSGFAGLLEKLVGYCSIAMVLEGGYDLDSISKCAAACLKVLLGDKSNIKGQKSLPYETTMKLISQTRKKLRPYWKVFETDLPAEVYSSCIPYSSKLVDPIENRCKDEEVRAQATRELLKCIIDHRMAAKSLSMPDRDAVDNECTKAEQWLREGLQLQESLPKNVDPVFWSHEIKKKEEELEMFCRNIARHMGSPARSDASKGSDHMHTSDRD